MSINIISREDIVPLVRTIYSGSLNDAADAVVIKELLSEAVRNLARVICPCSLRTLRRSAKEMFYILYSPGLQEKFHNELDECLDSLIEVGDLIYLSANEESDFRSIYISPPCFVPTARNSAVLLGSADMSGAFLPLELASLIRCHGYVRRIELKSNEDVSELLRLNGFSEISPNAWANAPRQKVPSELIDHYQTRLNCQRKCVGMSDIEILGGNESGALYSRRWKSPVDESGLYVGRRKREYGSNTWGAYLLEVGRPVKVIDFPNFSIYSRGCDEAWHLLMALDCNSGSPQKYSLHDRNDGEFSVTFYSPIPSWAHRWITLIGRKRYDGSGLFSYDFGVEHRPEIKDFLSTYLWLVSEAGV